MGAGDVIASRSRDRLTARLTTSLSENGHQTLHDGNLP